MTQRERQLLEWIRENPMISQQELAIPIFFSITYLFLVDTSCTAIFLPRSLPVFRAFSEKPFGLVCHSE